MYEASIQAKITHGRLFDLKPEKRKALLVGTYEGARAKEEANDQLDELENLCKTFGLEIGEKVAVPLRGIDSATFIGKGKVEEFRLLVQEKDFDVVVFDDEISPQQQRNLERDLEILVIDRVELILGIFAQRAKTKEAVIQIELAECRYQLPRLKGRWSHLGRQGGGGGGDPDALPA